MRGTLRIQRGLPTLVNYGDTQDERRGSSIRWEQIGARCFYCSDIAAKLRAVNYNRTRSAHIEKINFTHFLIA